MANSVGTATVRGSTLPDGVYRALPVEHASKVSTAQVSRVELLDFTLSDYSWGSLYLDRIKEARLSTFKDLYLQDFPSPSEYSFRVNNSATATARITREMDRYKSNFGAYVNDFYPSTGINSRLADELTSMVSEQTITGVMVPLPEDACEVCKGTGKQNGEECWHCEGEGVDPSL